MQVTQFSLGRNTAKGFTIIELLIVIVIIAILATISTVAYNGIQRRAAEAEITSSLRQATTVIDTDQALNGVYPANKAAINNGQGLRETASITFYYDSLSDGQAYCLTAVSSRAGVSAYHVASGGSITEGPCEGHPGTVVGGGGTPQPPSATTYSIFGSAAPAGTVTLYSDGGGSLRTANRFYTTRSAGIRVVGLRVWSPAGASSDYLTQTITARAYLNDWQGSSVSGETTFGQSPVATKIHSPLRTAGAWQDIRFDTPITLPAITTGANGNDLISLSVEFSGGDYYGIVTRASPAEFESTVSGGEGVYLAEYTNVVRSIHNLLGSGSVHGDYVYLIDILYESAD